MHHTSAWRACPCSDCRARVRAYNRDRMRARRADGAPRLVDPKPVLEHLTALREEGMTVDDIASVSGYHRSNLFRLLSGTTQRVRSVMAEDILSIPRGARG